MATIFKNIEIEESTILGHMGGDTGPKWNFKDDEVSGADSILNNKAKNHHCQ